MTIIYIDADACPVKDEALKVAERHNIEMILVSNSGFRTGHHPLLRSVVVEAKPDAADIWIADAITKADVCVTNDIPLAARCVEVGAHAIAPNGKVFDQDSVGMALAMRDLMTDLRSAGEITSGSKAFDKKDRSNFLNAMETLVRKAKGQ